MQIKAGQRDYDRRFGNDNYPTSLDSTGYGETKQRIRPMDLTLSYAHLGNGLLTVGVDAQSVHYWTSSENPEGVVTPDSDVTAHSTGLFLQEKIQIHDWVLRAGVRHSSIKHQYDLLSGNTPITSEASWSKNLWSLGVRYNFTHQLSFYGNSGSSFMAPAARQVGGSIPIGSSANGQLPNTGLHPESGVGSDLGLDWRPTDTLTFGLRAFLNRIQDAIIDNVVSVTPSQSQSVNAGSATAKGFEWNVQHTWSNKLYWFANLTYTKTHVDNPTNTNNDDTAIPFAPDYVANLCLTAQLPKGITLSPYYHWVGRYYDSTSRSDRQPFGRYGVLNTRLQTNLMRNANYSLNLTVDLNNLLDKRFEMPWGFQDPGFNAFAGLNLVF